MQRSSVRCSSTGKPKAAVFPEPVSDCPIMSLPAKMRGIAFVCIVQLSVGFNSRTSPILHELFTNGSGQYYSATSAYLPLTNGIKPAGGRMFSEISAFDFKGL